MENNYIDGFIYPGKSKKNVAPPSIISKSVDVQNYNETTRNYKEYKKNIYSKASRKKFNKNKHKFIFRMIYASFILITFIVTGVFFFGAFGAAHNNFKFIEYDKFILPVVLQDPDPFNEDSPPSSETVLHASIWKAASSTGVDKHNYDNRGRVIVSTDEIKESCHKLFGDDIDISLENISSNDKFYEYIPEDKTFYVDSVSYDQCFVPNTVSVMELNNRIILKVEYMTVENQPEINKIISSNDKSEKCMEYTLKKNLKTGNFYISEIKPIK